MKIHYISPFSTSNNIGGEYNNRISELPKNCYVVLRDCDTMFLNSDIGHRIEAIILANPEYQLITCMTNRIGLPYLCVDNMFDEPDIQKHLDLAQTINGTNVYPCLVAPGMLMIFHKSVWEKVKFIENSIYFDRQFSQDVLDKGMSIGVATGLYLFHLYRFGKENPRNYTEHLLNLQK